MKGPEPRFAFDLGPVLFKPAQVPGFERRCAESRSGSSERKADTFEISKKPVSGDPKAQQPVAA